MQGFWQKRGCTKKRLIAGLTAMLVFALMAPAATATSIVAQADPEDNEQASASTPLRGITSNEIKFLEDNWYLGIDETVVDDADQEPSLAEALQERNRIQFLEDNLYIGTDNPGIAQGEPDASNAPMTRAEMYFIEENLEFGLTETDEADESDVDEDDDDSDTVDATLPHPWGGDSTELDY